MNSPKAKYIQVENKNAVLELLRAGTKFKMIYVASNAFRDEKTKEILSEAGKRRVPIERITRKQMTSLARTSSVESVIGLKPVSNLVKLSTVIEESSGKDLFLVIIDNVHYAQNLGAIIRSAFGAGVDAVIIPKRNTKVLTDEVTRVSMGTSERIPIVQMNLFDAIKRIQDAGIKVIGVHMEGEAYYKSRLTGSIALVVGAEDTGISLRVKERCDELISIPMEQGIGSLNVSAAASIVMYEKKKQDDLLG